MKSIIVTGNLGFIGFNFCQLLKKKHPEVKIVGVDSETYAAQFMLDEKKAWNEQNDIFQLHEDIRFGTSKIDEIVKVHEVDTIVHFAAESHVDNSIKHPNIFFETNVLGTANLLNIAKDNNIRIHVIGTDEVYGMTWPNSDAHENYPLCPSSPYSSSKASADLIALSYFKTFGTAVTVSRCTNNFGPWQHYEKLIPTVISHALETKRIPVYGDGLQKRHWIHVDEHNEAVIKILEDGELGQVYNIAPLPENYISNIDIIKFILDELRKPYSLIEYVADRLGHDTSYFLKDFKFQNKFGNANKTLWKDRMKDTIKWYTEHYATV